MKPKASATITPKQSATVSSSTHKGSDQKTVAGKTPPGAKTHKGKETTKPKSVQKISSSSKVIDPKKKSIFSPENSSDSEAGKPFKGQTKTTTQVSIF